MCMEPSNTYSYQLIRIYYICTINRLNKHIITTHCNNPPSYDNNADNRCKFFIFFKVCARVEEGKPTHWTLRHHSMTDKTQPRRSPQEDARRTTSNCKQEHPKPRRPQYLQQSRHSGLGTVRTQKVESMVVGLLFLHRKAGCLILVLCSGERGGQIGSWPTAQAETSNPLRCVARVETLPLKGPRLLIWHWILDAENTPT
jgi:hypothetical protein